MKRRALLLVPALAVALLTGQTAGHAQDGAALTVAVGGTATKDVGQAVGLHCDDNGIASVSLRTVGGDGGPANEISVTGVKEGTTLCRVGTVPGRPSSLFRIIVTRPDAGP